MIDVIEQKSLKTNKNLIMIQSKLYAPSYSGPGKWVIYNTETKKAMLAVGKDKLPEIVPILTEESGNRRSSIVENESYFTHLLTKGLLVNNDDSVDKDNKPRSFVETYQSAVFNFPFRDYHDPNWLEKDNATMSHYSKLWAHPPMLTERVGEKIFLSDENIENLNSKVTTIDFKFISLLLKTTFGPLETINSHPVDSYRRTSPSGGAKHPTEAVIFLNKDYGDFKKGAYIYDVKEHALIRDDLLETNVVSDIYENSVSVLIRSKVNRPMWRYRDIRSYRAILLDAGHIVETIRQICEYKGLYTKVDSVLLSRDKENFDWLQEPQLCIVHITTDSSAEKSQITPIEAENKEYINTISGRYMTNPTAYFTFEEGNLICNTLWPTTCSAKISFKEFEVLTHCLPSRRGDRDISEKGIYREILAKKSQLENLKNSNALLPEKMAKSFYNELSPWIQHNWYLNFMVHCASHNKINYQRESSFRNNAIINKPTNLFSRKTSRKFTAKEIPLDKFKLILESAIPKDQKGKNELIINIKNVEGLQPGLYKYENNELNKYEIVLSAQKVRSTIIGQPWAGKGAIDIWVKRDIDFEKNEDYEITLIELGSIGQRICISCLEEGLGVFMTPAIKDIETNQMLKCAKTMENVYYYFTVGYDYE